MRFTILDAISGRPVAELPVRFEQHSSEGWKLISTHQTDDDGTVKAWLVPEEGVNLRCVLDAGHYFASLGVPSFYPDITVAWRSVNPGRQSRVTVLISSHAFLVHETVG